MAEPMILNEAERRLIEEYRDGDVGQQMQLTRAEQNLILRRRRKLRSQPARSWTALDISTPEDFVQALEDFGMTQQDAARFFDVAERNVRRWASGDMPVPLSVEMVFVLMREFDLSPEDVDALLAGDAETSDA